MERIKTVGERIGFGKATSFDQAIYRLPDRTNPLYDIDSQIEHLTHLKERLTEFQNELPLILEDRYIPLSQDDISFMERISFRRGKRIVTAEWEHIPKEFVAWSDLLPVGDDNYRWWQISEVEPVVQIADKLSFVSIEMNRKFQLVSKWGEETKPSEFEIGFVFDWELENLVSHLNRRNK